MAEAALGVSGFLDADGIVFASRIETDASGALQVRGRITDADSASNRFALNALEVDYSTAMIEGFASGEPQNGDFVRVVGAAVESNARLRASLVERKPRNPLEGNGAKQFEAAIEGFVTRFASLLDFDVDGQPVAPPAGAALRWQVRR